MCKIFIFLNSSSKKMFYRIKLIKMKFIKSILAIALLGMFAVSCTSHQSCAAYSKNETIEKNTNEVHATLSVEEDVNHSM